MYSPCSYQSIWEHGREELSWRGWLDPSDNLWCTSESGMIQTLGNESNVNACSIIVQSLRIGLLPHSWNGFVSAYASTCTISSFEPHLKYDCFLKSGEDWCGSTEIPVVVRSRGPDSYVRFLGCWHLAMSCMIIICQPHLSYPIIGAIVRSRNSGIDHCLPIP